MRNGIWIAVLLAAGCAAPCSTYRIAAEGGRCATPEELNAELAKEHATYAAVTQTINPASVAGCRSLGVVSGQNELNDGVLKAARMGANAVLLGAQTTAQEGPFYDYAHGSAPIYHTRTYVAMEAYVCPVKPAEAGAK